MWIWPRRVPIHWPRRMNVELHVVLCENCIFHIEADTGRNMKVSLHEIIFCGAFSFYNENGTDRKMNVPLYDISFCETYTFYNANATDHKVIDVSMIKLFKGFRNTHSTL